MAAESLNISIEQGSTFSLVVTPTTPIDLTGYTGRGQIRAQCDDHYPVVGTIAVAVAVGMVGIHTLSMTAAETAALPVFGATKGDTVVFQYDIMMGDSPAVIKQEAGTCTVTPAVTR